MKEKLVKPIITGTKAGTRTHQRHWSLVIGHWSLVIGHWSLVIGHWSLVIGHWSLVIGSSPPPSGFFSFFFSINCIKSENERSGFLPSSWALVSGLTTLGFVAGRSITRGPSSRRGGPPWVRRPAGRCRGGGGPCC